MVVAKPETFGRGHDGRLIGRTLRAWTTALVLGLVVACSATQPSQLRVSVAGRGADPSLGLACAQRCEGLHEPGSGDLFECFRRCPGVEASFEERCDPGAGTICYGKRGQAAALDGIDRDNAARLAIGMLRGLRDASLPSVARSSPDGYYQPR